MKHVIVFSAQEHAMPAAIYAECADDECGWWMSFGPEKKLMLIELSAAYERHEKYVARGK